ncbi:THAP domain-containing protein 1-like [Macrobrachium rosenbergii]|uniref:THAP domain-containing protein 1-like n=1 Tax=Macrobrachium rosenbergii TaxID=79674 RepID=UPI0034D58047
MRRENFTPTNYSRLCSKHFREEDIDRTSLSCVRLHSGAVPSIFEGFPEYFKENVAPKRKLPTNRSGTDTSNHAPANEKESLLTVKEPSQTVCYNVANEVKNLKRKLVQSKKKIKVLQQSKRRLVKRNSDLENVILELKRKRFISDESLGLLENCTCGVQDLIKRQTAKHSNQPRPTYSPELRSFALTLNFYSPHAYRYVRKVFDTCLPHPRTIRNGIKVQMADQVSRNLLFQQ